MCPLELHSCMYPDYHGPASAVDGFQVSFNLLARVVLGLN